MSVILKSDHQAIMKNLRKKTMLSHSLWFVLACLLLVSPYTLKLKTDQTLEAYTVAKTELETVILRQELLTILRPRPLTVGQALDIADSMMRQREIPIPIVLAVIDQESEFRPNAQSDKGARGLMQVIPATFRSYSKNPLLGGKHQIYDPVLNIQAGMAYLGDMHRIYGDWRKTLRAYYAGPDGANSKKHDWYINAVMEKAKKYEKGE